MRLQRRPQVAASEAHGVSCNRLALSGWVVAAITLAALVLLHDLAPDHAQCISNLSIAERELRQCSADLQRGRFVLLKEESPIAVPNPSPDSPESGSHVHRSQLASHRPFQRRTIPRRTDLSPTSRLLEPFPGAGVNPPAFPLSLPRNFMSLSVWASGNYTCGAEDAVALAALLSATPEIPAPQPSTNCCEWKFVKCNANSAVTGIVMSSKGLAGTLPHGLYFPHIESLDFRNNFDLHGSLDAGWSGMTSLRKLDLSNTQISGTLPSSYSALT